MCDAGKPYRKRGKENLPLIPPLKESPKKKSPQSACARVREEEPELAARFDEFWAAYPSDCPRKSNKAKCLKKYISLLKAAKDPSALHSAILAGLDRWKHCVDWAEDDGKFIKAPLVWLNNENWDDSPRAANAASSDEGPSEADRFLLECMAKRNAARKEAR
jgi:hypothetical protein